MVDILHLLYTKSFKTGYQEMPSISGLLFHRGKKKKNVECKGRRHWPKTSIKCTYHLNTVKRTNCKTYLWSWISSMESYECITLLKMGLHIICILYVSYLPEHDKANGKMLHFGYGRCAQNT